MLITTLIGSIVVVNGPALHSDILIKSAQSAVNGANIHQLATALEVYYSDHDAYPAVIAGTPGGASMIDALYDAGYIRNKPNNPEAFKYELKDDGQDYKLSVDE
mgnify:CR=1 FL=1